MAAFPYRSTVLIPCMLALMCGAAMLSACGGKQDDAEAIRELIRKGADLAEEKQIGDLLDLTAPGFAAMPGGYDVRTVKGILFGAFMHYKQFKIHYPKPSVDMEPGADSALATVRFLIVRQNQDIPGLKELYDDPRQWMEKVGEKADLYQLELEMKKSDGNWLVMKAELEGFKGTGF